MFRRREGLPQTTRRKRKLDQPVLATEDTKGSEDEEVEGQENERLREVLLIQRQRLPKWRGLPVLGDAEVLPAPTVQQRSEGEGEPAYDLLDKAFRTQGTAANEAVDRHLQRFLREKLEESEKKKAGEGGEERDTEKEEEEDKEEADAAPEDPEQALYALPDELKVPDTTEDFADRMHWVTGLVEVPLPLEYKLKNIEETEKARRRVRMEGGEEEVGGRGRGRDEPRREDASTAVVHKAFGERFQTFEKAKTVVASDDAALERFRKRFRK